MIRHPNPLEQPRLALSARIAEHPFVKDRSLLAFEDLARLARRLGYDAICMRASQAGTHTPRERLVEMRQCLDVVGLAVSMVTANFDIAANNAAAPDCLRDIGSHLDVAQLFGCDLIRVAIQREDDIVWAQRAADAARERGIRLAHQTHAATLFETIDSSLAVLARINRPNFGLIFEPTSLLVCGSRYGPDEAERIAEHVFDVFVQNIRLSKREGDARALRTNDGTVWVSSVFLDDRGDVDFDAFFDGLARIGYRGYITLHSGQPAGRSVEEAAATAYTWLRARLSATDRSQRVRA